MVAETKRRIAPAVNRWCHAGTGFQPRSMMTAGLGGHAMRFLAVIVDHEKRAHLVVTRAPDLKRREIGAATGSAEIVWCMMVSRFDVMEVGRRVKQRHAACETSDGVFAVSAEAVISTLNWHIHALPRLKRICQLPRTVLRRAALAFR